MTNGKSTYQLSDTVKTIVTTLLAVCAAAVVFFGYFYAVHKINYAGWEEQKKCFKELTLIMERSPREKKEWIEKTIMARKNFLGGTDYCAALELITESEKDRTAEKSKPDAALKGEK